MKAESIFIVPKDLFINTIKFVKNTIKELKNLFSVNLNGDTILGEDNTEQGREQKRKYLAKRK